MGYTIRIEQDLVKILENNKYNYVAFGDNGDTQKDNNKLNNEIMRVPVSQIPVIDGNIMTGLATLLPNVGPDFIIREIGWFVNGTDTKDSGIILSRIVPANPITKNKLTVINFTRTDTAQGDMYNPTAERANTIKDLDGNYKPLVETTTGKLANQVLNKQDKFTAEKGVQLVENKLSAKVDNSSIKVNNNGELEATGSLPQTVARTDETNNFTKYQLFSQGAVSLTQPTNSNDLTNKDYVDSRIKNEWINNCTPYFDIFFLNEEKDVTHELTRTNLSVTYSNMQSNSIMIDCMFRIEKENAAFIKPRMVLKYPFNKILSLVKRFKPSITLVESIGELGVVGTTTRYQYGAEPLTSAIYDGYGDGEVGFYALRTGAGANGTADGWAIHLRLEVFYK